MFFSVVWTVWEARNNLVFKGKPVDLPRVEDMVRFRVGWWFKHFGGGSSDLITLILLNLVECCSEDTRKKFISYERWSPPVANNLVFNVDGSVRSSYGHAGIGGVLRDHHGKVLCFFSSFVGVQDATAAEIMAIAKACELLGTRTELIGRCISIASDSKIAVDWVKSRGLANTNHMQLIQFICNSLDRLGKASVDYCLRSSNSYTDILAKKGAAGCEEVCWSE